ncbi:glycosyltransferase family 32 protein [Muricoccus aerilatus]|uniref:glycosyltransferase family 32 protein n=1 Tax=Muricoccus aerilatus TaxID=452982 RepID=UPI0012EC50C3|nr:glycosyltransferase [Roseomonas aerilata]
MVQQNVLKLLSLNQVTGREYIPRQPESFSIPRIIHQTYRSWDALPQNIRDSIEELRARNAGWEYRFYDDADVAHFIRDAYGAAVLARFERIDPRYGAARADLFRYLLAYRVGGVYLDIKSTAHLPLDEILQPNDRLVLAQWPQGGRFKGAGIHDWDLAGKIQGGEIQQWHIICAPGHPYIYAVIQAVMRNIDCYIPHMHGGGRNAVLRLTGPIAYTLAMLPLMPSNLHRLVAGHDDLGLDYSVYRENSDHKTLFATHYADLTYPIVRASGFRRLLSEIYRIFDALRRLTNAKNRI